MTDEYQDGLSEFKRQVQEFRDHQIALDDRSKNKQPHQKADFEPGPGPETEKAVQSIPESKTKLETDNNPSLDPKNHGNPAPGTKEHNRRKAKPQISDLKSETSDQKVRSYVPDTNNIFSITEVRKMAEILIGKRITKEPLKKICLPAMEGVEKAFLMLSDAYPVYYRVTEKFCPCAGWYYSSMKGTPRCRHHSDAFPEFAKSNAARYESLKNGQKPGPESNPMPDPEQEILKSSAISKPADNWTRTESMPIEVTRQITAIEKSLVRHNIAYERVADSNGIIKVTLRVGNDQDPERVWKEANSAVKEAAPMVRYALTI